MPRQVRIEYAGAFYHVMARGDRRKAIVKDDEDRKTFVRTLGEAAERAGFRIHAWVLMTNHYHLLVETPQRGRQRGRIFILAIWRKGLEKKGCRECRESSLRDRKRAQGTKIKK